MTWLFENPTTVLVLGAVTAVIFGAIWLQTGRKIELYVMLAILACTVGLVGVGRFWKSDAQQVKATIQQVARDVERNDVDAVLAHLHPSMDEVRQRAANEMPHYSFEQVKVKSNLAVELFLDESPPRAEATFNVVVIGSDTSGLINGRRVPRFMRLTLLKEGDAWRISDYQHDDPRVGFQKK
jgi:flagellar motor component MotA